MSDSEPERQVPSSSSWSCAPVNVEWHHDWEAFHAYMTEYQANTHQIFRQRTSTSVQKRNREILAQARLSDATEECSDGSSGRVIPDEFKNFWIKLVCTHGWKRKSRGKGIRKAFFDKSTGCKANIKAAVVWNDKASAFMVRVTNFDVTHNHNISKAIFANHVSNRRVDDPTILAFVDELQAAGSKTEADHAVSSEENRRCNLVSDMRTGKNVTLRDVHNMVAKLKEKRRGKATTEERLEAVLRGVCEGRGNRATVFVDDANTAQTITLQTRQMRRWFKAFPEVLLVDAGQYVHHSLMENESVECILDAINSFKFHNPSWEDIKVIVIDKDLGELGLLEDEFPGVKVILCHFHLKKYIRSELSKSEYGGPSSFDKDQVEDAVDLMRLASTIEEYTKYLKYLYFLLDGVHLREADTIPVPEHPFLKYFMKNWDSMKERWSLYARSEVPHLGNHTNNRLETSWGHIKEILKAEMTLDECVDTLVFLQAAAEMEYAKKMTDVGQMRYEGADAELERLAREVSPHAYHLVEEQYRQAQDRKTHYEIKEIHSSLFVLTGGNGSPPSYHVNTEVRCVRSTDNSFLLTCSPFNCILSDTVARVSL
ncbi:hypothetical protein PHMEG_0008582 [Phytophthora megakarya]|uniref:ZSWIM1/3 RNaseH-like domain-containing protein n=1 Tax=Phytophthora megakarya TaxID=4795 RepID=A0A225WJQ0_9STRA|nr:hypothetical protein PHMEG_0008582 [Phytophthora megakarya]